MLQRCPAIIGAVTAVVFSVPGQPVSAEIEATVAKPSRAARLALAAQSVRPSPACTLASYGQTRRNAARGVGRGARADIEALIQDDKAFEKGLNNTTTARALLALMEALAQGRAVDKASSGEMIAILKRQTFNDRIPAGLPPGIAVAHKTGEITRSQHDAAIVYADRPFALVVLVRGLQDPEQGSALTADITRALYRTLVEAAGKASRQGW